MLHDTLVFASGAVFAVASVVGVLTVGAKKGLDRLQAENPALAAIVKAQLRK